MPDPNVVIVFGSLLCALALSLAFAAWHQSMKRRDRDRNLTRSEARALGMTELKDLMRDVVLEATQPLERRLAALESQVRGTEESADDDDLRALPEHQAPDRDQSASADAMSVPRRNTAGR